MRSLLNFIDDTPVVPGDARQAYEHQSDARKVLESAETDLRAWAPSVEPLATTDELGEDSGLGNETAQDTESLNSSTSGAHDVNGVTGGGSLNKRGDEAATSEAAPASS